MNHINYYNDKVGVQMSVNFHEGSVGVVNTFVMQEFKWGNTTLITA